MTLEDSRLQIHHYIDAFRVHLPEKIFRVRETLLVPVENVAQVVLFAARISACKPEIVDVDVVLLVLVDYVQDFLVAVLLKYIVEAQ